jgi:hypothetical protein
MAFAAAMVVGVVVGNPAETVLWRAIIALASCWIVGYLVGRVLQRTAEDYVRRYKESHPIPETVADLDAMERETMSASPDGIQDESEEDNSEFDRAHVAQPTPR